MRVDHAGPLPAEELPESPRTPRIHSFAPPQDFHEVPLFTQFAANPARALRGAARVSRTGTVVVGVFGKREASQSAAYIVALGSLLPPPPPGAPGPLALSADGALEALAREAGLMPGAVADVDWPWAYPDERTALRGLLSTGPALRAIEHAGEDAVRDVVLNVIAPFRTGSGGYRIESSYRYMLAQA